MARITVEDCTLIPNRFELVVYAGARAKELSAGAPATVKLDNDRAPVIALREIAAGTINPQHIKESIIARYRQYAQVEPQEEELADLLEQELAGTQHIVDRAAVQEHVIEEDIEEDEDFDDLLEKDLANPDRHQEMGDSQYEDADEIDD